MLWDHERAFAYVWSGGTISNLPTHAWIHYTPVTKALKPNFTYSLQLRCFFFLDVLLFWITITQHVFDKAWKGNSRNHIIHINMSQSTQWCATKLFPCLWGNTATVTSKLRYLSRPLGGRGPLLWVAPQGAAGRGGRVMPWFQTSGLVNMPQTVVKDDNENGGGGGWVCQSALHIESIYQYA